MISWLKRLLGNAETKTMSTTARGRALGFSQVDVDSDSRPHESGTAQSSGGAVIAAANVVDIVDGLNSVAAYYSFIEAELYDMSLRSVRERRDFRDEYLRRIAALIAYVNDTEALAAIDREIQVSAEALVRDPLGETGEETIAVKARRIDPEGFDLLDPSVPLTFEALKTAYRRAAKRYHPDVGGDTVEMQRVNDSYAAFHTLLQAQGRPESIVGSVAAAYFSAPTADQSMRRARIAEFMADLDDLAIDRAFQAYSRIRTPDFGGTFGFGIQEVCRLASLLAACGRNDDAHVVLGTARALSDMAAERGLRFGNLVDKAVEIVADTKKLRLILNHRRQADNALRLHLVDEARYMKALVRIEKTTEAITEERETFVVAAADHRYTQLPADPAEPGPTAAGLVPNPDYYARIDNLTPQQRNEYWQAFFGGQKDLIPKYAFVRATALLQAVIAGFDIDSALAEARAFADASPEHGSFGFYVDGLVSVLEGFQNLPESDLDKRLKLLRLLDADPRAGYSMTLSFGADGDVTMPSAFVLPQPILLTPAYLEFMREPLEAIRRYIQTGHTETPEAYAARIEESREIIAFQQSALYQRALHDVTTGNSENSAASVAALLEEMYSREFQPGTRRFDIAHWTDRLTIDLAKLKRYHEAVAWIDRFRKRQEAANPRATPAQLEAIEKRRIRCEKMLMK